MIEIAQPNVENYILDYAYELKRIIKALTILIDKEDEKSIRTKRKLVELHNIFSLENNVKSFAESDRNYYHAIASKNNANYAYDNGNYEMYADEMITLNGYIKENEEVFNFKR
jgi:cell fate (sporulation/competence/biofilm development) regulator YlbF (YheA/YmcA/DUF963 family)